VSDGAPRDEDRAVDDYGREFIARRHRFPANGVGFLITPVLWFVYFLVIYSLHGAGCAGGLNARTLLGTNLLQLLMLLLTAAVAAVIVALGVWSYRSWKRLLEQLEGDELEAHGHMTFLAYGALLHAGLFLVATLWIGVPSVFLEPCGSLGA